MDKAGRRACAWNDTDEEVSIIDGNVAAFLPGIEGASAAATGAISLLDSISIIA